jgi:uncharacterized protein (DUF169 family)
MAEHAAIKALGLSGSPVAIGFLDEVPPGVERWTGGEVPAGCTFWRFAKEGKTFYTEPSDHWNCAVGSYTHAISLPPERGAALQDTVGFMVGSGYIEMSEVPGIPVLPKAPKFIAYGPVENVPFQPDVILIASRPAAAMLLYEAAVRSGAAAALSPAMGRPACAVLPLAKGQDSSAFSFGCKGNRTYTGLPDDELYFCVPAGKWESFVKELATLEDANQKIEDYSLGRRSQFPIID